MAKTKNVQKRIKNKKPTSPGQRFSEYADRRKLNKVKTPKSLLTFVKNNAGRSRGKISMRHQGGGVKRMLRQIDFKRDKFLGVEGEVMDIQYDPGRNTHIALLKYATGQLSFILASEGLKVK